MTWLLLVCIFLIVMLYLREYSPLLYNRIDTIGKIAEDILPVIIGLGFIVIGLPLALVFYAPYIIQSALAGLWKTYYTLRDKYFLKWCSYAEQKTIYIGTYSELREILGEFS